MQSLPIVHDLDATDTDLDELSTLAKDKFNDLMDLGMNMDPRFGGVVFQTAGTLLGHAITAKTAKNGQETTHDTIAVTKSQTGSSDQ